MASGTIHPNNLISRNLNWNTSVVSELSSYKFQYLNNIYLLQGTLILNISVASGNILATNVPAAAGLEGRIPIMKADGSWFGMLRIGTNGSMMVLNPMQAGTYYFSGYYTAI